MLREIDAVLEQADVGSRINAVEAISHCYTLIDLANDIHQSQHLSQRRLIKALLFCLEHTEHIKRVPQDDDAVAKIASHIAAFLSTSPASAIDPSNDPASPDEILGVLGILSYKFSAFIDNITLLSTTAYTDSHVSWSSMKVASMARSILDHALGNDRKHVFITTVVLEEFIRPIFSQNSSSRITQTGRKTHFIEDSNNRAGEGVLKDSTDASPWRNDQVHAIITFSWAVEQSNGAVIGKNWPLFTPVLLALIDDADTDIKARGLEILQEFLARCPAGILQETGLGEIFEQSVFPTLLSLPRLTPEDESVRLLESAYGAAMQLANAQFPDERSKSHKHRLLIRLLREGLIAGYWHASEYVKIVELLARQASSIVQQLGIFTTPYLRVSGGSSQLCHVRLLTHMQELLSMFTAILTDPFLVTCPACIQLTSHALSVVMLNCWPRVSQPAHSGEVLRAISVCWLNLKDEQRRSPVNTAMKEAMEAVSNLAPMLAAIFTSAGLSMRGQLSSLCVAEPDLIDLFPFVGVEPKVTNRDSGVGNISQVAAA